MKPLTPECVLNPVKPQSEVKFPDYYTMAAAVSDVFIPESKIDKDNQTMILRDEVGVIEERRKETAAINREPVRCSLVETADCHNIQLGYWFGGL